MQILSGLKTLYPSREPQSTPRLCAVVLLLATATASAFADVPAAAGFYVAPNGSDRNPGTLEAPVATLARAQHLMRTSSIKTTYIRAGLYVLPADGPKACNFGSTHAAVALTSADNDETWSFYPPDGYDTAVLDGQSTQASSAIGGGNGLGCAFAGTSIHDVQIVGLAFKRFLYSALWVDGMSDASVIGNVVAGSMTSCFMIHGGQNNDMHGNLCDLGVAGIQGIVPAQDVGLTRMSGNAFHNNVVITGSKAPGLGFFYIGKVMAPIAIADNAYFNYAGTEVLFNGTAGTDTHPICLDPRLSSPTYTLAKDSPMRDGPVSFAGIPTRWGPPGFVIPQNGTPPSYAPR